MEPTTADRPAVLDIKAEPQEAAPLARREEPRRAQVVQPLEPRPGSSQAQERVVVRYADEHMPELFAALAKAQGGYEDLERTRTARIESAKARYSFDYETLADVIEATKKANSENGLAVMQFPFPGRDSLTIRTMLTHSAGGWIYNDLTASIDGTDPRAEASGITYLCRYARKAILGIAAAYDDDAEAASQQRVDAQGGAPRPAPRKSEQAVPPAAVAAAPVAEKTMLPVGVIVESGERDGAWFARLDTGFTAATRDKEIGPSLLALDKSKKRVELVTRAPRTPGYAPTITEVVVLVESAK